MFEKEIEEYEHIRTEHQEKIADSMSREQWIEYNEILFSAHSCAIEGNSFTVDDTRILREQGMAMIPVGRSCWSVPRWQIISEPLTIWSDICIILLMNHC